MNTGVTAHIDAFGRVVSRAPREVTTLLVVTPALLEGAPTLYVRFGDWTWGIGLTLAAAASVLARRRNGSHGRPSHDHAVPEAASSSSVKSD